MTTRICFVCLGNICRSPTAEAIFRSLVDAEGRTPEFVIASAGTGDWHLGEPPDRRSAEAALARGVRLAGRAEHFTAARFADFDLVVAMDRQNEKNLARIAPDEAARRKIRLLRSFDESAGRALDVPDPYYGGADGFAEVFEICRRGCEGLLASIPR